MKGDRAMSAEGEEPARAQRAAAGMCLAAVP
jgi:hypothetical protein